MEAVTELDVLDTEHLEWEVKELSLGDLAWVAGGTIAFIYD